MTAPAAVGTQAVPRQRRTVPGAVGLLGGALLLWSFAARRIDLRAMDDTGLVSVIPLSGFAALAILLAGFAVALKRDARRALLLAYVVAIAVVCYGTVAVVGEALRGVVVWRHLGVTDALLRLGRPDPTIDAYFNWPGFFMLLSSVRAVAGPDALMLLARWAPLGFSLLYLAPLALITRTVTGDRRMPWLTCCVFLLVNWVNQDYLAPQALGLFFYLVIAGVLLRRFPPAGSAGAAAEGLSTRGRGALLVVVVLLYAVTVASHQLTPFAILAAAALLVVTRRCPARGLPLVMAILAVGWLLFMAVPYMKGHAAALAANVGSVSSAVGQNVNERVQGSAGHLFVVRMRLLFTAAVWGLAALGALRQWRRRELDLRVVLLAAAPFPLLIAQPYGGEMLMRVYLFSLPFTAILAAAALVPRRAPRWWWTPAVAVVLVGMLGGFLVSRYGNERMDQFSAAEVEAVDRLYALVPVGGLLVAPSGQLPWRHRAYEQYDYLTAVQLGRDAPFTEIPRLVEEAMRGRRGSAIIFTRSQRAGLELLGDLPISAADALERHVAASPSFRLAFANEDARIFLFGGR